jgi:hypothetical protein
LGRWLVDQYQPGHPWFKHQALIVTNPQHDAFAGPLNALDWAAHQTPPNHRRRWTDSNWLARGGEPIDGAHGAPHNRPNSATHRFDFREFGHGSELR